MGTPQARLPIEPCKCRCITAEECEKLRFEFLTHFCSTHGRFGCDEERVWPCTIKMNKRGGMTDNKFDKYIKNRLSPSTQISMTCWGNVPIKMSNTLYGQFLATQKRGAEKVYQKMSPAERDTFLQRLTEIEAPEAKEEQSQTPNPTPIANILY